MMHGKINKITSAAPPTDDLTKTRLQLYRLGYTIIPTRGKQALLSGWNSPDFIARELTAKPGKRTVEERIAKWPTIPLYRHLQSTGVRIEQGLAAIDNDIDDGPMIEAVLAFIADIAPDIHARAPRRYGGGTFKLALFVQKADEGAELAFSKKRSHKSGRVRRRKIARVNVSKSSEVPQLATETVQVIWASGVRTVTMKTTMK